MGSAAAGSPFGVVVGSQPMQGPDLPGANYAFSPDDAGQLLTFSCAQLLVYQRCTLGGAALQVYSGSGLTAGKLGLE